MLQDTGVMLKTPSIYMYRLKTDFYKLQDMGINVKNYNILYFEEFKKKHIMNFSKLKNTKHTEFKNKKSKKKFLYRKF